MNRRKFILTSLGAALGFAVLGSNAHLSGEPVKYCRKLGPVQTKSYITTGTDRYIIRFNRGLFALTGNDGIQDHYFVPAHRDKIDINNLLSIGYSLDCFADHSGLLHRIYNLNIYMPEHDGRSWFDNGDLFCPSIKINVTWQNEEWERS